MRIWLLSVTAKLFAVRIFAAKFAPALFLMDSHFAPIRRQDFFSSLRTSQGTVAGDYIQISHFRTARRYRRINNGCSGDFGKYGIPWAIPGPPQTLRKLSQDSPRTSKGLVLPLEAPRCDFEKALLAFWPKSTERLLKIEVSEFASASRASRETPIMRRQQTRPRPSLPRRGSG